MNNLNVVKINKYFIDRDYIRDNVPYALSQFEDSFLMVNRDGEIIDKVNGKLDNFENHNKTIYLYDNYSQPYDNRTIKLYMDKFNTLISNLECLNINKHTTRILNIFKEIEKLPFKNVNNKHLIKYFIDNYLHYGNDKTPDGLWNIYKGSELYNLYKDCIDKYATNRKFYKLMKENGHEIVRKRVGKSIIRGFLCLERKL
jgi:hypothetical protein